MTVVVNPKLTPVFTQVGETCWGEDFILPDQSLNGINGIWTPAKNLWATTTYTFIPNSGECAVSTTMEVEVGDEKTPTFSTTSVPTSICKGDTSYTLPLISDNGVTGTWSPAFNNQNSEQYTFTPNPWECAKSVKRVVLVDLEKIPVFTQVAPICQDGTFVLPTTSLNGVSGTWSPPINNQMTIEYTFTPTPGQCATTNTMTVVVNTKTEPTFPNIPDSICKDGTFTLPVTSQEGIIGTWSPAVVNNQTTTEYTFTPNTGYCAKEVKKTIKIDQKVTPVFTQIAPICQDGTFTLPSVSLNSITGTWSPAINNQETTTYTFTPNPGECAVPTTMKVEVKTKKVTLFDQLDSICYGGSFSLNPISKNGVAGSWFPAANNQQTTEYTFTPSSWECATEFKMTVEVTDKVKPTFTQIAPICQDGTFTLPSVSLNSITGTWSPAINNQQTTKYTFTANTWECATNDVVEMTVEVKPRPILNVSQDKTICLGGDATLTASGALTYSWTGVGTSGSSGTQNVSPTQTTIYKVIGTGANGCVSDEYEIKVTVVPISSGTTPSFSGIVDAVCSNEVYVLPTMSDQGITGSWSPLFDPTTTTEYTFTPDAGFGVCVSNDEVKVTIVVESSTNFYLDVEAEDLVVECDGSGNITELQDWLNNNGGAIYNGHMSLTWSNDYDSLSSGCSQRKEVTFIGTNSCGDYIETKATFTIEDTTQPTLIGDLPQDTIVSDCDDLNNIPNITAIDNCDDDINVVFEEETQNGSNPSNYILIRTWKATDICGNQAVHTQILSVPCTDDRLEIYNGISANADDANDIFYIEGIEKYKDNVVQIFNRWGVQVYKEYGYDNTTKYWDGVSGGHLTYKKQGIAPEGTYFYFIEYTNFENKRVKQSGYLYLSR